MGKVGELIQRGANLDASMFQATVGLVPCLDRRGKILGLEVPNILFEDGLIAFGNEDIVGFFVLHQIGGQMSLRVHGVGGRLGNDPCGAVNHGRPPVPRLGGVRLRAWDKCMALGFHRAKAMPQQVIDACRKALTDAGLKSNRYTLETLRTTCGHRVLSPGVGSPSIRSSSRSTSWGCSPNSALGLSRPKPNLAI